MTRSIIALITVAVGVFTVPAMALPRMFLIPAGGDPAAFPSGTTFISANAGDTVCLEIWASGDPTNVFGIQAQLADAVGGVLGPVTIDCSTIAIDVAHPSYIGLPTAIPGAGNCPPKAGFLTALAVAPPASIPLATTGAYMGELCYVVSNNSSGTFTLNWRTPGIESTILDENAAAIANVIYDPLVLIVTGPIVPSMSEWSVVFFIILGLSAGTLAIRGRRAPQAA